jgi:hypothetical protein
MTILAVGLALVSLGWDNGGLSSKAALQENYFGPTPCFEKDGPLSDPGCNGSRVEDAFSSLAYASESAVTETALTVVHSTLGSFWSPCWLYIDNYCTEMERVNIGTASAKYTTGGKYAYADNFFDGDIGDCGANVNIGYIESSHDYFIAYASPCFVIDENDASSSGIATFSISCYEFIGYNCQTPNYNYYSDFENCSVVAPGAYISTQQLWADSAAACNGSLGDPASQCNMPDVGIPRPTGQQSWSYQCRIRVDTCDEQGLNCIYSQQYGCINVYWK